MTKKESIASAQAILEARSTRRLIEMWEEADRRAMPMNAETATVRGWIMNELEQRNAGAFEAWINSTDDSPRAYYMA